MVYNMWKGEKNEFEYENELEYENETENDLDSIKNLKSLEKIIRDLQLRLNHYESTLENINKYLIRYDNQVQKNNSLITDIRERFQDYYEKDKEKTNNTLQFEKDLYAFKEKIKQEIIEEINVNRQETKSLERRYEEIQSKDTEAQSQSRSKIKKKRNIAFENPNQYLNQFENPYVEKIQRVASQGRTENMTAKKRRVKQQTNNIPSNAELAPQKYTRNQISNQKSGFNPLKYF